MTLDNRPRHGNRILLVAALFSIGFTLEAMNPQAAYTGEQDAAAQAQDTTDAPGPKKEVVGTVVPVPGQVAAGIEIVAYRQDGRRERSFTANDKGEFLVPEAWWSEPQSAGDLFVLVAKDSNGGLGWYQILSSGGHVFGPGVRGAVPTPFKIQLLPPGRTVRGRILDSQQQPLAGVRVQVHVMNHPVNKRVNLYGFGIPYELPFPATKTDASGRFELQLTGATNVTLFAMHSDWIVRMLDTGAGDQLGDVTMARGGKIAGRVVHAETGQPIAGVPVHASCFNALMRQRLEAQRDKQQAGNIDANSLGREGHGITDADGNFEIGGLRPEEHQVSVTLRRVDQQLVTENWRNVDVQEGKTAKINFSAQRGRHVVGRLIDAGSSEPLAGMRIDGSATQVPSGIGGISHLLRTNAKGEFDFYVFPGPVRLHFSYGDPDNWKPVPKELREFEFKGDAEASVELKLERRSKNFQQLMAQRSFVANGANLHSFVLSRDGNSLIAAGGQDSDRETYLAGKVRGDIRIWDLAIGKEAAQFGTEFGFVLGVALSPDGGTLLTAGRVLNDANGGQLTVWDLKTRKPRTVIPGGSFSFSGLALSPDGKQIAAGRSDQTLRVFDSTSGKELTAIKQNDTPAFLRFVDDGRTLIVAAKTGKVRFCDIDAGREQTIVEIEKASITGIDVSADQRSIAVAYVPFLPESTRISSETRAVIRVVNVLRGKEQIVTKARATWSPEKQPYKLAFSPNGKYLADSTSSIWDADTGEEIAVVRRSSWSSDRIRFLPNGKSLLIAGQGGIEFWDTSGLGAGP